MALSKLEWSCMDDLSWKLDDYSLKPLTPPPHHTVASEADEIDYQDYALVVTGDVFRWMINHAALETLQRVCPLPIEIPHSLTNDVLYARCSSKPKYLPECPPMRRTK